MAIKLDKVGRIRISIECPNANHITHHAGPGIHSMHKVVAGMDSLTLDNSDNLKMDRMVVDPAHPHNNLLDRMLLKVDKMRPPLSQL